MPPVDDEGGLGRVLPIIWPVDKSAAFTLIGRSLLQAGAAFLSLVMSGKGKDAATK